MKGINSKRKILRRTGVSLALLSIFGVGFIAGETRQTNKVIRLVGLITDKLEESEDKNLERIGKLMILNCTYGVADKMRIKDEGIAVDLLKLQSEIKGKKLEDFKYNLEDNTLTFICDNKSYKVKLNCNNEMEINRFELIN